MIDRRVHRRFPSYSILLALLAMLGIGSGCATTRGDGPDPGGEAGASVLVGGKHVGTIEITADAALEPAVQQTIEQFKVVSSLDGRLRTQLLPADGSAAGVLVLNIRIIKMRVRSTASALWWGVMAGADYITVQVDVLEAGRSLKTFETGTSTALGGFIFGGREVRISRMLDALSKRIAGKI
jgi:Domain of unknown function (DUF4410)